MTSNGGGGSERSGLLECERSFWDTREAGSYDRVRDWIIRAIGELDPGPRTASFWPTPRHGSRRSSAAGATAPMACVIGDLDVLRPIGLAGIPCAVAAPRGSPVCFSRFTRSVIELDGTALVDALAAFAGGQAERPVLFYERDWALQAISSARERLRESCRVLLPDADLVDQLVDKARFQALAERLDLPVPRARTFRAGSDPTSAVAELEFPVVVKPVPYRDERWREMVAEAAPQSMPERLRALPAKSIQVDSAQALTPLLRRLLGAGLDLLVQELVPGPEGRIETYNAYIDADGRVAGEFTGRTIRTYPAELGISTALTTTEAADLADLGREVLRRLGFRGVAMVETKRTADGRLHLLEVNPRFTRWLRLGAAGGLNLPAMVYADLTGSPRPRGQGVRAGVTWCRPRQDAAAAAAQGVPMTAWLRWLLGCDLNSSFSRDDPLPYIRSKLWRRLGRGGDTARGSGRA